MDSKELRNLHEAYMDVYAPQEIDEAVKGESGERRKDLAAERRSGIKPLSAKEGQKYASHKLSQMSYVKRKRMGEEVEGLDEIDSSIIARAAFGRNKKLSDAQQKEIDARDAGASMGERSKLEAETSAAAAKVSKHRALSTAHALSRKRMRDAGQNVQDSYEYDTFDVVLEYLVTEGYADTNESALVIMANMSEEWRQSIVEVKMDPRGRPASGSMNVYAKSKPNTDPAFQAALKSVRDADAKKTPEQRKAELDAYRERQMNNK